MATALVQIANPLKQTHLYGFRDGNNTGLGASVKVLNVDNAFVLNRISSETLTLPTVSSQFPASAIVVSAKDLVNGSFYAPADIGGARNMTPPTGTAVVDYLRSIGGTGALVGAYFDLVIDNRASAGGNDITFVSATAGWSISSLSSAVVVGGTVGVFRCVVRTASTIQIVRLDG
jgi:hypothetical protein